MRGENYIRPPFLSPEVQGEVRVPRVHGELQPPTMDAHRGREPQIFPSPPMVTSRSPQRGEGLRMRGENYIRLPFLSPEVHGERNPKCSPRTLLYFQFRKPA